MNGLGVRTGSIKTDTVTFVAFSESSDSVTITLSNGRTIPPITMSIIGNDRTSPAADGLSHIGYVGDVTVSGLQEFTQYTYTATNGTDTTTGSFYTSPSQYYKGKYSIALTTCMFPSVTREHSVYEFLNWYRKNTEYPLIANIHPDDVCYPDNRSSFDDGNKSYDSSAPTWSVIGALELSEYNYSYMYGSWFGVLGDGSATGALENSEFQEYLSNVNFMPQAGDHEYGNNIWNVHTLGTAANPLHATGTNYDGVGRVTWNAFMKPLCGDFLAVANTESHHWECKIGAVQVIAPDCISNTSATSTAVADITSALGTDQIEELLSAMDNDYPLKLIANPAWAVTDDTTNQYEYKTEQYLASEVSRFLLDDGTAGAPLSVMNNPKTNGEIGNTLMCRGDSHFAKCYKFSRAASGTNLGEEFYELGLMAANGGKGGSQGSAKFSDFEPTPTGIDFVGGVGGIGVTHRSCVIIEVDATGAHPKITAKKIDYNWSDDETYSGIIDKSYFIEDGIGPDGLYAITFQKRFAPYQSTNLGDDGEVELKFPASVASGGKL